ncbi:MAG: SEC-C metal-binding domain-containing protein, partial [Anaerolineae bacterium]
DDVINKQRQLIYDQRRKILSEESLRPIIMDMVSGELGDLVGVYTGGHPEEWDLEGLFNAARAILPFPPNFTPRRWEGFSSQEIEGDLLELAQEYYDEKERGLGRELISRVERLVLLRVVDNLWIRHLTALDELRQGVGLRAFGQRDPLVEFKTEAYGMFQALMANIRQDVTRLIYHAEVVRQPAPRPMREVRELGGRRPVATAKEKVGRNDPCPCGSGKKYKHCCLRQKKRGH